MSVIMLRTCVKLSDVVTYGKWDNDLSPHRSLECEIVCFRAPRELTDHGNVPHPRMPPTGAPITTDVGNSQFYAKVRPLEI